MIPKASALRRILIVVIGGFLLSACGDEPVAAGLDNYKDTLRLMWGTLYAEGGETLYCARSFGRKKGKHINVEHVFPMSWVANELRCGQRDECRAASQRFNKIEADLHNLWPSRKDINKARGSMPFGMIKGEQRRYKKCDLEIDEKRRIVEPRPEVRGDIARSMFYMSKQYNLEIHNRLGRLLKKWNKMDPPDGEEKRRNGTIERLQGNRNPYIDTPALADKLRF